MATVTLTIPDEYVSRIISAFSGLADKTIRVESENSSFDFIVNQKTEDETNLAFGKRFINSGIKAIVKLYELGLDRERYVTAVSAVPNVSEKVPDDIIT